MRKPCPAANSSMRVLRVEQQDIGGIHAQLTGDLAQDDGQDDGQVETGVDGGVDGMQGREALQVVAHLLGGGTRSVTSRMTAIRVGIHGGDQARPRTSAVLRGSWSW